MKVFISSVFRGMEPYRAAAAAAVQSLGYDPIQAEDFPVSSTSPRVACLDGVRAADAVILLLGERYGPPQASGLSATHEEYREAKDHCPVFAFVRTGVALEDTQRAFLDEVQSWSTGHYRGTFSTEEDLRQGVTTALHRWEVARTVGKVDGGEMLQRAVSLLPSDRRQSYGSPMLSVAVAGGPSQSILRPSELEGAELRDVLLKSAIFGETPIFTTAERSETKLEAHSLIVKQESRSLLVDEQGSISLRLSVATDRSRLAYLIEEEIRETLNRALRFAAWALSYIDPKERLSHVAVAVAIGEAHYLGWRTRREHEASPNSGSVRMPSGDGPTRVNLSPPHRSRAALRVEHEKMAEDLLVLLRRPFKS